MAQNWESTQALTSGSRDISDLQVDFQVVENEMMNECINDDVQSAFESIETSDDDVELEYMDEIFDQNMSNAQIAKKRKSGKKKLEKGENKKPKLDKDTTSGGFYHLKGLEEMDVIDVPTFQDVDYEDVLRKTLKSPSSPLKSPKKEGKATVPPHLKAHEKACIGFTGLLKDLRTNFWSRICSGLEEARPAPFHYHVEKNIFSFFQMYSQQINILEDSLIARNQRLLLEGLTTYKRDLGKASVELIDNIVMTHELLYYSLSTRNLELTPEGNGQKIIYDFSNVSFYNQMLSDIYNIVDAFYELAVVGDMFALECLRVRLGNMRTNALVHLEVHDRSKLLDIDPAAMR